MRRHTLILTLAVGIVLGLISSMVAQDQAVDPRSSLERCQVNLAAVRDQLVNVDERANALQTRLNRQVVEQEQQEVTRIIEASHAGCTIDWVKDGALVCEPVVGPTSEPEPNIKEP